MTRAMNKLDRLKSCVMAGECRKSIRLAAKFPHLGNADEAVRRAAAAMTSPSAYEGMGYDVADLIADAMRAICERYDWDNPNDNRTVN